MYFFSQKVESAEKKQAEADATNVSNEPSPD